MVKINQRFVEVANARLSDLKQQVELLSIAEMFDNMGNSAATTLRKEHAKFLSKKFGKSMTELEDFVAELNKVTEVIKDFVQVDYLSDKFSKLSSNPKEVSKAFSTIKQDHAEALMKVLEIEEDEVDYE